MNTDIFKKQLIYRSMHRGCKETDILLGKFINEKITTFDDDKLKRYEQLIAEDDLLIYDWVLNRQPVAEKYVGLINEIRAFHGVSDI